MPDVGLGRRNKSYRGSNNALDSGTYVNKKNMEQYIFKFRVQRIEVGNCDVVMTINDKVIPYSASYLGCEPMASMIEICSEMMREVEMNGEDRIWWADEPGGLRFTFIPNKEGVLHIDIADEITKEEWHEDVLFDAFVTAIISESFRVLKAFGLYGYRNAWASDTEFPLSQLMLICELYNMEDARRIGYTSDFADEADFLKQHSFAEKYDTEKQLDECALFYDAWQMQCCGKQFSVGDKVNWTCVVPTHPEVAGGRLVDFYEDHHKDFTHKITGTVTKIISQFSDSDKGKKIISYDTEWIYEEAMDIADGWSCGRDVDDTKKRTLWGYIVELKDVTVKPLEEISDL